MPVYFARIGDRKGSIKIGFSGKPHKRMQTLTSQYGQTVTLLAVMPGGFVVEDKMHKRFEFCRGIGQFEIFNQSPELLALIEQYKVEAKPLKYRTKAEARNQRLRQKRRRVN